MNGKIIALYSILMLVANLSTSCVEENQDFEISVEELELSDMVLVNQTFTKQESQDPTLEVYIVTSIYKAKIEDGYTLITYEDEITYLYDDFKETPELNCQEETILFYSMDSDQDGIPNKNDPEPCWQN